MMTSLQPAAPFATALRYATAPYARGMATQALTLGSAAAGVSAIAGYDFTTFQSRYGLQSADLVASYVLTLKADQLDTPAVVEIGWVSRFGAGTSRIVVPAGSLAGESFGVPGLPSDPNLVLRSLSEQPPPTGIAPSGPGKWDLSVLLGNGARLLWTLTGEAQTLAAAARDVRAQRQIETARGGSLDRIGAGIGVSRLLAAPYRLDYDLATVALYHLDDAVMPVVDATHDYPGASIGAQRGIVGKFGQAAQITAAGGIVIPDAVAFAIDPAVGFTVEMFANLAAAPGATEVVLFAQKRPRFDQSDSPGWALALEPSGAGHALTFTLTDSAGVVVSAAATAAPAAGSWFHVAGVIDPAAGQARVLLNGAVIASAPLGTLGRVDTGADIGLGCDPLGATHLNALSTRYASRILPAAISPGCLALRRNPIASTHRLSPSTTSTRSTIGSTRSAASILPRTAVRPAPPKQGSPADCNSQGMRCRLRIALRSVTSSRNFRPEPGIRAPAARRSRQAPMRALATARARSRSPGSTGRRIRYWSMTRRQARRAAASPPPAMASRRPTRPTSRRRRRLSTLSRPLAVPPRRRSTITESGSGGTPASSPAPMPRTGSRRLTSPVRRRTEARLQRSSPHPPSSSSALRTASRLRPSSRPTLSAPVMRGR